MAWTSNRDLSNRHELEVAGVLPGGVTTVASGALGEKNDVYLKRDQTTFQFSLELKCTSASSFSVSRNVWEVTRQHAYEKSSDSRPGMAIRLYGTPHTVPGRPPRAEDVPVEADLVLLDLNDFVELVEEIQKLASSPNSREDPPVPQSG